MKASKRYEDDVEDIRLLGSLNEITPTSLSVSQLLGAENEQYVIPAYQRRYSWNRHQVEDLWDDLQLLEAGDSHLFGTIVCLAEHHTAGLNRLELVDGQQRIATISILLHCLLERLKAEKQVTTAIDLQRLLVAKAQKGSAEPKILLDSLDAKQFKKHASGQASADVENPRLLQAFEILRRRIAGLGLDQVETVLYRLKNQSVIIRLDVSEAKDAFKLFETINNRGLRLSAADIIKNFILGNAARFGAPALDLARERWSECLLALDGIPIDTFFRQYMIARLHRRVTRSEVVEEFQRTFMKEVIEAASLPERSHFAAPDESDEEEEDEAIDGAEDAVSDEDDEQEGPVAQGDATRVSFAAFLDDLVMKARVYREVMLAETGHTGVDRRLRNLRLIKAQQSYGFLMALRAGGCTNKDFEKVLKVTEAFLVRRHVTRARANENETVFAQLCAVNPLDPLDPVRAVYREYYPRDDRFRQEFAAAFYPSRLIDRARYFLEQIEMHEQGKYSELFPGGPDTVHVEHIIPLKIKTKKAKTKFGDWVKYLGPHALQAHPKYVGRIGNLTLFSGELNIGASNNPYHRKKSAHGKSAFKLTKSLPSDYPEFRFDQVDARSEALAALAVKIWPVI